MEALFPSWRDERPSDPPDGTSWLGIFVVGAALAVVVMAYPGITSEVTLGKADERI